MTNLPVCNHFSCNPGQERVWCILPAAKFNANQIHLGIYYLLFVNLSHFILFMPECYYN